MNARWAGVAMLAALMLLGAAPVPKIQSMLARPKILCGRFDQSKQLVGLKKPVNSNGRFCVVADKGVLWRTLQPFANTLKVTRDEIIQLSGERVAVRLDARQEPAVRMINSVLFALLAGDLEPLEKLFDIDGAAQDKSWSVKLKPRDAALSKVISGIALDGGTYVKSIVISEASGDRTEIEFSAIQAGDGAMNPDEAALF
jgi:Outer membrane lipoprotein carrier protein LolA-like